MEQLELQVLVYVTVCLLDRRDCYIIRGFIIIQEGRNAELSSDQ